MKDLWFPYYGQEEEIFWDLSSSFLTPPPRKPCPPQQCMFWVADSARERRIFTMGARYCLDLHRFLWSSVTTWYFVMKNTLLFNLLFLFQTLMTWQRCKTRQSEHPSQPKCNGWGMDSFAPHTIRGNTIFWDGKLDFKLPLHLFWTGIWNNFADTEKVRNVLCGFSQRVMEKSHNKWCEWPLAEG